jgi:hypothetical protein
MSDDLKDFFASEDKAKEFAKTITDGFRNASKEFDSLNSKVTDFSDIIQSAAKNFAEFPKMYKSMVDLGERTNAQLKKYNALLRDRRALRDKNSLYQKTLGISEDFKRMVKLRNDLLRVH